MLLAIKNALALFIKTFVCHEKRLRKLFSRFRAKKLRRDFARSHARLHASVLGNCEMKKRVISIILLFDRITKA